MGRRAGRLLGGWRILGARRTIGAWRTFGLMTALWIALALYTNERVLTPQVLASLTVRAGGTAVAGDRMEALQRMERLSYGLIPLMLGARVAMTAVVLQLFAMLLSAGIAYRDHFRASLWGFSAVLYGMFIQTLRLDLLGPGITMSELSVVPDSLAALISEPGPTASIGYNALSLLSIHGTLWIGIVFTYLHFECHLTPPRALLVPLAGWTTVSLTQLGLQAFTVQILG